MTLSCCLMVEAVNTLHLNWSAVTNQISFQLLFTCLTFSWLLHCQLVSSCFTFPLEIYCHTWSASLAVWSNYLSFSSFCFKVRQRWAFFPLTLSWVTKPFHLICHIFLISSTSRFFPWMDFRCCVLFCCHRKKLENMFFFWL